MLDAAGSESASPAARNVTLLPGTRRCLRSSGPHSYRDFAHGVMFFADPVAAFRNIGRRAQTGRSPHLRLLGAAR